MSEPSSAHSWVETDSAEEIPINAEFFSFTWGTFVEFFDADVFNFCSARCSSHETISFSALSRDACRQFRTPSSCWLPFFLHLAFNIAANANSLAVLLLLRSEHFVHISYPCQNHVWFSCPFSWERTHSTLHEGAYLTLTYFLNNFLLAK